MTTLIDHARAELNRIGLPDTDPTLCASLLAAVDAFTSYGHSGSSAAWARDVLGKLLAREPLTPISSDPAEWELHQIPGAPDTWQNRRDSRLLSHDGGRTYWNVDDPATDGAWAVHTAPTPADVALLTAPDADPDDHFERNVVARRLEVAAWVPDTLVKLPSSFIDGPDGD